eukprot:1604853-Prymnesium_polylepis.1
MRRRRRLLLLLAVEGAGLCAGDRFVRRGRRPRARAGAGRLRRRVRQHHQREDRRPRQRHAARARQRRGLEGGHRGGGRLGAAGQPRRRLRTSCSIRTGAVSMSARAMERGLSRSISPARSHTACAPSARRSTRSASTSTLSRWSASRRCGGAALAGARSPSMRST